MIVVNDLVAVLLQCFLIILAGYVSGRLRLISAIESQGISKFVTYFALPALVFRSLAILDFTNLNWAFVVSILVSKVFVFILISVSTMLLTHPCDLSMAGLFAIFCTQSNDFAVGYPIISSLYSQSHPSYLKYLYLLAPIQLVILNPVGFFMMEIQKQDNLVDRRHDHRDSIASILSIHSVTSSTSIESSSGEAPVRPKSIIVPVLKGILLNPIIVMTFVGIGWNFAFSNQIPVLIDRTLEVLALSFSASALFLLGLNMVGKFALLRCSYKLALPLLFVVVKSVMLPVVIRLFIDHVFTKDIDASLAHFSFLYGTIPAAPTSLIFALQYGLPTDAISTAIVLSTFFSAPIMFVYANMQVLTKSCQDLSLDAEQYDLMHQNKSLDLSLTIRFANLSNNAQLELKKLNAPRAQSNVSVAVQSESGQRTTGFFMPNTSLYQVIAETSGLPAAKTGQQVVCLFTRREIVGEDNLKSTTLKSLGLNSGSAVLRILVRDESVLGGQAFVEDLRLKKDGGKVKATEKVVSDVKQNVSKSFKSLKKMVSNAFESIDKSNDAPCNLKKKSQTTDTGGQRLGSSYDQPSSSDSSQATSAPPQSSSTGSAAAAASDDKECSPVKEECGKINILGEREALIFSQSDIPKMHSKADADDSFFELTKDDVMVMYQDLKDQVRQMHDRPLETSHLRERKDAQMAKRYTKAVLRICFPNDGLVIQANFTPTECISDVLQFIRQFLTDESMDFYLFTTPPKVILKADQNLHTLKLVPAANVHFGYSSQTKVLKAELKDKVTPFEAIIQATAQLRAQIAQSASLVNRDQLNQPSVDFTVNERQIENSEAQPSTYVPRVQTTAEEKIPKWFKKGK